MKTEELSILSKFFHCRVHTTNLFSCSSGPAEPPVDISLPVAIETLAEEVQGCMCVCV